MSQSRAEQNERQRAYRRATGNACTLKYERTKPGKLMRCYRNMESRIKGIQAAKYHLYAGKELLSREAFYEWALVVAFFSGMAGLACIVVAFPGAALAVMGGIALTFFVWMVVQLAYETVAE